MVTTAISSAREAEGSAPKLLGLEVIRFICAMTVLVWHYHHFAMIGNASAVRGVHQPLETLLYPLYHFGLFGVQIFWAISGFIFYYKYGDALAARRIEPKRFFWLRFSRLYPLHFVTLLIVAALQPAYRALAGEPFVFAAGNTDFLLQLGLADQWAGPRAMSFNGPIWSVSTEVLVYVAFFVLLRAFGKSPWIIVAAIAGSLASMWSSAISPALVCAGYFFAGGAAADWVTRDRTAGSMRRGTALALCWFAAAAAIGWLANIGASETLLTSWLLLACPPLLYLGARDFRLLDRWSSAVRAAGNMTYSTYLIHFPLQLTVAIAALAFKIALPLGSAWLLLAYLATVIVLGRFVFLRFEAPMQRLIRAATLTPKPIPATT